MASWCAVVRGLGLPAAVQRYHLGFMGCYAALPALRAAAQFCRADPDAVVLVASVELCTLHLRSSDDPDAKNDRERRASVRTGGRTG